MSKHKDEVRDYGYKKIRWCKVCGRVVDADAPKDNPCLGRANV